ncbi:MAG: class I SAM-dependent methyltransferase [Bacteroidales bacterium]|nr:class I SAM-dependent methyltransferase [Bacteroidales bacterium]
MEKEAICKVCGSNSFLDVFQVKDTLVSGNYFNIKECEKCGLRITYPYPEASKLGSYYLSKDYISHTDRKTTFFEKLYGFVKKYAIKKKVSLVKDFGTNALDMGCGTGSFLEALRNSGKKVYGIEPDEGARAIAVKKAGCEVYPDLNMYLNLQAGLLMDCITLWHVLEHIPDFDLTILKLVNALSEGGKLLIAVPMSKSYDAAYYGSNWAAYDVPRHLFHFNRETLKAICEKSGLKLISHNPMFFDSFYVSILSERSKKRKFAFLRGSWIGLVSNLYALFGVSPYSSEIFIFEKK